MQTVVRLLTILTVNLYRKIYTQAINAKIAAIIIKDKLLFRLSREWLHHRISSVNKTISIKIYKNNKIA